jgi:hypothetical protein
VEQVGLHDNFFDLGGHSLLMAQIHPAIRALCAREITLVDLFTYPTVHALARFMSADTPPQTALASDDEDDAKLKAARNRMRLRREQQTA